MQVLKLTNSGMPAAWINVEQAAIAMAKSQVTWSLGESMALLRGGVSKSGIQSSLDVPAIIAVAGAREYARTIPLLTNRALFRRDRHQCLYCGEVFPASKLTRDHVIPRGQGGQDTWCNVVASCEHCNQRKGCCTPEQAQMPLLAVPFTPNAFEAMYLSGGDILSDQLNFLQPKFSDRHWLQRDPFNGTL